MSPLLFISLVFIFGIVLAICYTTSPSIVKNSKWDTYHYNTSLMEDNGRQLADQYIRDKARNEVNPNDQQDYTTTTLQQSAPLAIAPPILAVEPNLIEETVEIVAEPAKPTIAEKLPDDAPLGAVVQTPNGTYRKAYRHWVYINGIKCDPDEGYIDVLKKI